MINQGLPGAPTSRRFALCPTTVKSGDFVLLGSIPAVALDSYSAQTLGTTFEICGSFNLSVIAKSVLSPATNKVINPGDAIYFDGGTLDSATNVTTGGTLDANSGGTLFGYLDPQYQKAVATGTTDAAALVMLRRGD